MTLLKYLIAAAAAFGGFVALMYVAQRSLMYHPERLRTPPEAAGLFDAQEIVLDTADGEKVIAWHVPPRGDAPTVLYFHGNGGSLRLRVDRFQRIVSAGVGLIALSYRGYGGSTGKPTEDGLINDARAAYAFAADRYPRIALWGESLGTGVAVALAAEKPVTRMVLDAPYTSALDLARANHWYLPVRLLMKDQFRSDLRVAKVTAPVLVMHGDRDEVVPISSGQRLYKLITSPKRFVRLAGGGHENLGSFGAVETARGFIAEKFE